MTSPRMLAVIAASALTCSGAVTVAMAQKATNIPADPPDGRVYAFHSQRSGGCPSLDWHVVLEPNNSLSGFIATDDMSKVFRVSGTLGPDRTFRLNGKEIGGAGTTGTVDG